MLRRITSLLPHPDPLVSSEDEAYDYGALVEAVSQVIEDASRVQLPKGLSAIAREEEEEEDRRAEEEDQEEERGRGDDGVEDALLLAIRDGESPEWEDGAPSPPTLREGRRGVRDSSDHPLDTTGRTEELLPSDETMPVRRFLSRLHDFSGQSVHAHACPTSGFGVMRSRGCLCALTAQDVVCPHADRFGGDDWVEQVGEHR